MPRSAMPVSWLANFDDRLKDRAASDNEVGAVAAYAGQSGALVVIHLGDHRADLLHRIDRHVEPVDSAAIVRRKRKVDTRERSHRAAGAEQSNALLIARQRRSEAGESIARALTHAAVGLPPIRTFERGFAFALG